MSRYALPPATLAALDRLFDDRPRRAIIAQQAAMSAAYRDGRTSQTAVPNADAAMAYAAARMPATFAAVARALEELQTQWPSFEPASCVDIGAGPGTATLAANAVWPSLGTIELVEPNAAMRAMATTLLAASQLTPSFQEIGRTAASDLALLSYVLIELPQDRIVDVVRPILARNQVTVIVEPGTPQGFARIHAVRAAVVAEHRATVLAPCTHQGPCPMAGQDWCHFNVRLQRSRLHRSVKDVDAPFEDERFAYLIIARSPPPHSPSPRRQRLMSDPVIRKSHTQLRGCGAEGLSQWTVPHREKATSKALKRLTWGDTVDRGSMMPTSSPKLE